MRSDGNGQTFRHFRTLFDVGSVAGLTDGELIDRFNARRGEVSELAFAVLLERHGPMVRRVCRRVLGDPSAADDAFQATFLVLARKADSVRDRASLAAWLHGVALRVAARLRDRETRRRKHERTRAERASFEVRVAPWDDTGLVIHEELARLPERLRNAAVLCYLEGNSYEEAARQLGCPTLTIKSRLVESRRRLRRRLERRGLAPAVAALAAGAELSSQASATTAVLPPALAEFIVQSASQFAAGPAAASGMVPASVAAVSTGVLRTMFWTKLKWVAATAVMGMLACGAVVLAQAPAPGLSSDASPYVAQGTAAVEPRLTPPADPPDRLQALEKKLDRLIQVLERDRVGTYTRMVPATPAALPNPGVVQAAGFPYTGTQGAAPGLSPLPVGVAPSISLPTMAPPAYSAPVARSSDGNISARMQSVEQRLDRLEKRVEEIAARGHGALTPSPTVGAPVSFDPAPATTPPQTTGSAPTVSTGH